MNRKCDFHWLVIADPIASEKKEKSGFIGEEMFAVY